MLRHASIKFKLMLIMASCTILALLVAGAGLLYYDLLSYNAKVVSDLSTETEVIGANCGAAMVFKDPAAVEEVLRALKAQSEIQEAAVYTPDGKLFAGYSKGAVPERPVLDAKMRADHAVFTNEGRYGTLQVVRQIRSGKDLAGYLFIESGMSAGHERSNTFKQILGFLIVLCTGIALLLGSRLQRLISRPILELAETMRLAASEERYDLRVEKKGNDEVGQLVDGFNVMLAEIEERDQELHKANIELEERVLQRTAELEREIVDREAAEQELLKSQRILTDFFENSSVGLHWLGPDSTILRANRAELEMLGYTAEEYVGRSIAEFHEDKEVIEDILLKLAAGETLDGYEARMRCKDGQIKFVSIESNVLWEDGRFVHARCFVRDMTAHKEAEQAIREREQAERSNLAKSEFLSRMSHELRTPMNAILGFGQLLEIDSDLSERQADFVRYMMSAGTHLLKLINEVLDISRIEAGATSMSTEPIAIDQVVEEVVSLVHPLAAQRNITIFPAATEEPLHVMADRQRLSQVLLNLVSNAIKYNIEGGEVRIAYERRDELIRLTVSDTGNGIPVEKRSKLFTPFERLGAEETGIEGTGLGLALSKNLVEAMGGEIGLEPSEKGTCFYIEFPSAESPSAMLAQQPLDEASGATGSYGQVTILLVEDNLANVHLMEKIIASRPQCNLIVAMQGSMALELAGQHHPDLILLDLNLPDIDGFDVLKKLGERPDTAGIPVAVVSADANPERIQRVLAQGAFEYLTKPLDVKVLLALLDTCFIGKMAA